MPLFTVIIPTHEHVETLRYAAASVLEQTVSDLELFIVGDGAPPRTREIAEALASADVRVRHFDFSKGERNGEAHRHVVLEQARGAFVAYQADDDLWLPDHLETLGDGLAEADFAHTMQIEVDGAGNRDGRFIDLSVAGERARVLATTFGSVGLNTVGHRLEAYRRLPHGWRPAPRGGASDHYMWRQFFAEPWCRVRSVPWPTALHLADLARRGRSAEERGAELATLAARLSDPMERARLRRDAQGPRLGEAVRSSVRRRELLRVAVGERDVASDALLAPGVRIGFDVEGAGSALLVSGFSLPEPWGVWTDGEAARLLLAFADAAPPRLRLVWRLQPFLHGDARPRVRGTLRVGETAPPVVFDLDRPVVEIVTEVDRAGQRLLPAVFTVANPASPASLGLAADPRLLGVGLLEIRAEA